MISRLFKIGTILLVLFFLAPVAYDVLGANGAVCPPGNVKYEIGSGYEYNDGSAEISGDAKEVCWEANDGYQVTSVCIKIGGDGGSLIMIGPGDGCAGSYDYGISHVVTYTGPSASPLPSPSIPPSPSPLPSVCPLPTFCPRPCPTSCPSPSPSLPPCPSPCPSPSPSVCPSPSPSPSPEPSPSALPSPSPSAPPIGGNGGDGSPPEWTCGAPKPPTPTLLSITRSTSVDLAWTAVEPVSHYSISYGSSPGNYQYGVDNTGNVTNYNVGGLDPGTNYCFIVRAVNDCAPSDASNEICMGEPGGQVLGATTLADTGSFTDQLFQILFIISSVCLGLGIKFFLPVKKKA